MGGPKAGPWLSEIGRDLGLQMAKVGSLLGAPKQAVGAHSAWPCVAKSCPESRCRADYELDYNRTALQGAKMTSITSGIGVQLGSILGPLRGPHFGRPNQAPVTGDPARATDLAADDFGARQDGRIWAPKFYSSILGLKTRSHFGGPKIGPWLSGAGPELRPKMA